MASSGSIITRTIMKNDGNYIPSVRNGLPEWYRLPGNTLPQGPRGSWGAGGGTANITYAQSRDPNVAINRCAVYIGWKVELYSENNYGAAGSVIRASTVVTNFRELAKRCTRVQKLQNYLDSYGCYPGYEGVRINYGNRYIARDVEIASINSQIDTIAGPTAGSVISASAITNFINALSSKSAESLNIQNTCVWDACHCSCHSSCHGSRARR